MNYWNPRYTYHTMLVLLTVYTALVAPFVVRDPVDNTQLAGFDVEFITEVYRRLPGDLSSVPVFNVSDSIPDVLDQIRNSTEVNELNVGIASITRTASRERTVDFSHGYFQSGLQVMTHETGDFNAVAGRLLSNFFTALALFLAGMLVIVSVMAPIAFLLEYQFVPKRSYPLFWTPDDGDTKAERMMWGMLRSTLWTLFTIFGTQTGYPRALPTRIVHGVLKGLAVMLVIVATAMITNVFIVSTQTTNVSGYGDLSSSHHVCTVEGTTSETYIRQNPRGFSTVLQGTIEESLDDFWAKRCDAIIYDFPVLRASVLRRGQEGFTANAKLVGEVFQPETYSIVLSHGLNTTLKETFNVVVLDVNEDVDFMDRLFTKYLAESGSSSSSSSDGLEVPVVWKVIPSVIGLCVAVVVVALLWKWFDDRLVEFKKSWDDNNDDDYNNDLEDVKNDEVNNVDYMYGVDWASELSLSLIRRVLRVVYQASMKNNVRPSHMEMEDVML